MSKASPKDRSRSSARPEDHWSNAAMSALRTAPATTIGRRSVAGSTPSRSALVRTNRSVSSASPLIVSTRSGLSRTSTLSCSIRARSTLSPPRTPMAAARQEVRSGEVAEERPRGDVACPGDVVGRDVVITLFSEQPKRDLLDLARDEATATIPDPFPDGRGRSGGLSHHGTTLDRVWQRVQKLADTRNVLRSAGNDVAGDTTVGRHQ
jgi:hypothetical protein